MRLTLTGVGDGIGVLRKVPTPENVPRYFRVTGCRAGTFVVEGDKLMRRTKPDRFLAGIYIDEGAALLVDSAETVHVAPTFFDQNEWCLEGDFGEIGAPEWMFVLFDDPSDMPGLVRSATACRIEMVSERELRVFGRGDPLGLAPLAVVSDPATIQPKTHASSRSVDFFV